MVRNSLKYVSWKERKHVASDLKTIYQLATATQAELNSMNLKINGIRNRIFKGLFSGKFNFRKKNFKFPPLDRNDINMRVKKLQDVLGIKKNLECKLLSERTILIKSR